MSTTTSCAFRRRDQRDRASAVLRSSWQMRSNLPVPPRGRTHRGLHVFSGICRRSMLTLALGTGSIAAHAEGEVARFEPENSQNRGDWYGWQILLADAGVVGLLVGGGYLTGHSSAFAFVPITGGVLYYSGGPLIHAAHRIPGAATSSLLRRLFVPLAPAAVGAAIGALALGNSAAQKAEGEPRSRDQRQSLRVASARSKSTEVAPVDGVFAGVGHSGTALLVSVLARDRAGAR